MLHQQILKIVFENNDFRIQSNDIHCNSFNVMMTYKIDVSTSLR